MKNKIKMDLALLMFATVIPNTAFAQDSSNQVPSEQVEFADIYIGDELITVPVVIESEIACKTARSGVQYEDTILFLTVSKNKIATTPENIGVVAILTVVLNYSILFPSFTFFLDGFHLAFGDKFEICIKTTDLM